MYDLESGTLLELGEEMYSVLRDIEGGTPSRAAVDSWEARGSGDALHRCLNDMTAMADIGLFRAEVPESHKERRATLRGLMGHSPRKMMLMVQSNCNLACSYCYEVSSGFHKTGGAMDFETAKRAVEFLIKRSRARKTLEITFFGGEPLMNFPLIKQLVAYCDDLGPIIGKVFAYQITTNGVLLSDDVIEFLVAKRFAVMLSIDGPAAANDIHRRTLSGKGVGSKVLENGKKLVAEQRRRGVRPAMVRATMSHENHDATALQEFFASQGFPRVMLGASQGRATEKKEWDIQGKDIAEMHEALDQSIEKEVSWKKGVTRRPSGSASLMRDLVRFQDSLRNPKSGAAIGCGVGRNMQAISRDGKIYPCHRYAGEDDFLLGSLEEGLNRERVEKY